MQRAAIAAGWVLLCDWRRPAETRRRRSLFFFIFSWGCRYHQYKFIVDGEWRHDESQPFMPDPLGNVNNWLFVRKPEPR